MSPRRFKSFNPFVSSRKPKFILISDSSECLIRPPKLTIASEQEQCGRADARIIGTDDQTVPDTMSVIETTADASAKPVPSYLYYQIYSKSGPTQSTQRFHSTYPYLGRIDVNLVALPHTVASMKRYVSKIEEIADYNVTKLLPAVSSATPVDDDESEPIIPIAGRPGSTPEQPLALVLLSEPDTFRRKAIVNRNVYEYLRDSSWLKCTAGEPLRTDGVRHSVRWFGQLYYAYRARTVSGKNGFVYYKYLDFVS